MPAKPAPKSYPHTRLWGAQLPLGILLFSLAEIIGFAAMTVVGLLLGEVDPSYFTSGLALDYSEFPWGFLAGTVICAILVTAGYWGLMRLLRGPGIAEIGLSGSPREFAIGLGIGAGLMSAVILVLAVFGSYKVLDIGWDAGIVVGLGMGIMAGFAEEILFRGLFFRLIEAWLGTWGALAVTSLMFGLMHITNPEASLFGAIAIALEAGILLGACYVLTRRLWLAIGTHVAWNFVQGGIFGSDVSGTGSGRGLIEASFPVPICSPVARWESKVHLSRWWFARRPGSTCCTWPPSVGRSWPRPGSASSVPRAKLKRLRLPSRELPQKC